MDVYGCGLVDAIGPTVYGISLADESCVLCPSESFEDSIFRAFPWCFLDYGARSISDHLASGKYDS